MYEEIAGIRIRCVLCCIKRLSFSGLLPIIEDNDFIDAEDR